MLAEAVVMKRTDCESGLRCKQDDRSAGHSHRSTATAPRRQQSTL